METAAGQALGADGSAMATVRPVVELTYAEASRELDEIVAFFERNDLDVDQLVEKLERAKSLVAELERRLRSTRMRVEELVPELQAIGSRELDLGEPRGGYEPGEYERSEADEPSAFALEFDEGAELEPGDDVPF